VLAHDADHDRLGIPVAQELDEDALADFGQGVEAAVLGGLLAAAVPAAVGGQRVQPGPLARRLRVQALPLELDLDTPLLLRVVLVGGDA